MTGHHDDASATYIDVDYDPFAEPAFARVFPSTEAQREVWLASRLGHDASLAYNESVTLRLRGPIDASSLAEALGALTHRHESLRATFSADGLQMQIADAVDCPVGEVDLLGLGDAAQTEALDALTRREVDQPFDLEQGPLFRAQLVRLGPADHALLLTAHHIVCDGWSFGLIVRDVLRLCRVHGGSTQRLHVAAPDLQFNDYAADRREAETTAEGRADADYWTALFRTVPAPLELPTDRPRRALRSFASARVDGLLAQPLVEALRSLGGRAGASLGSVLLAGFAVLLQRLSGSQEVVVGVPAAGQSQPGFEGVVGHCVNLLPVRVRADPGLGLTAAAAATQAVMLDAFEHQGFTFGSLLKRLVMPRDGARLPLVSVMFNLDQGLEPNDAALPGVNVDFSGNARTHDAFELSVNAVPVAAGLRLECQFNRDLFDAETVARWMTALVTLLDAACREPEKATGRLPLIGSADRLLLDRWNDTAMPFASTALVHEAIEAQAKQRPAAPALVCGAVRLTHRELDAQACRIRDALIARGVGPGVRVGLCVNRGVGMLAGLLGVLKTGAAYVPLDPSYPDHRLIGMVADAELALLIAEPAMGARFDWPAGRCLFLDEHGEPAADGSGDVGATPSGPRPTAAMPAYVIYTSGSTGKPKGVVVPHRAVTNFLAAMAREPGFGENDTLLAVTTLSFDIAVTELLLPLTIGGCIVLASRDDALDPARLRLLMDAHKVTMMQATPGTWRMLLDAGWYGAPGFKALCGGEALDADLARRLQQCTGSLWNMYGPTETTVWSTVSRVAAETPAIDIGRPIANTRVFVVDERFELCPIGVPGEIVIGGAGVATGYLHRPELTAERFVPDSLSVMPARDDKLYRTGDRGRWRNDGVLEHLGRNDFQVKVRGHRIELGEIEAGLLAQPEVAQCVVATREDRPGDVRIVAYVVARAEGAPEATLRLALRRLLPDYMLPQHIVGLPVLPRLPNGKIDRAALPRPMQPPQSEATIVAPASATERLVATAMETVLALPGLSTNDNFFALGGHSLLAAQLATRLGESLGRHVPMSAVFAAPTIAALAELLDSSLGHEVPEPAASTAGTDGDHPASLMQQRLWYLEQLDPGTATWNLPSAHRLTGTLDLPALEQAFAQVVATQASLRTALVDDGGQAAQRVATTLPVSWGALHDLSDVPAAHREARLAALLAVRSAEPIDLTTAPLFRIGLYKLSDREHVLFFMPHHAIWDGGSFEVFERDMAAAYEAASQGRAPRLPEPALTYLDFSRWQRQWSTGDDAARQLRHWRERLQDLPAPLRLRGDEARPERMTGAGSSVQTAWPSELVDGARALGARHGATLFMVLLAAWALLLHRQTGQRDILIGTPVAGRARAGLDRLLGFFSNVLPLRVRLDPAEPFTVLLERVRAAVLDGLTAPDVPIEQLVADLRIARTERRPLLYQAFFSFQDTRASPTAWGELQLVPHHIPSDRTADDLALWFTDRPQGPLCHLTFNTDFLSVEFAEQTLFDFRQLVGGLVAHREQAESGPDGGPANRHERPAAAGSGQPDTGSPAVARRTPTLDHEPSRRQHDVELDDDQRQVATIWREVLHIDAVRPTDNFFDLGGHSMLALTVVAQMQKQLGKTVAVRRLVFESLAQIAATPNEAPATALNRNEGTGSLWSRMLGRVGRRS